MSATRVLIVAESGEVAPELHQALHPDEFSVRGVSAAQLSADLAPHQSPDMVLVSASLGLHELTHISRRFSENDSSPTIVVYPDGDFAALESCVRGGYDYVTPPFLPSLLRSRMTSCWERSRLTQTVQEMENLASLREYERELSIAHEIQSGFLPEELPTPAGWELATRFEPARQVAGDFYDVFELLNGRRLALLVADVCDKGVGAALFMALIRTLLRHTAEHTGNWNPVDSPPGSRPGGEPGAALPPMLSLGAGPLVQAVSSTNQYLARNHLRQGYFATLFFAVLDPGSGKLLYINGGHNPPVLARANGEHILLPPTGPAVGMLANSSYTLGHTSIGPGDTLFMYTDGVVEARGTDGRLFGSDRMLRVVTQPGHSAEKLLGLVDQAVAGHVAGAAQSDDITMMALRRSDD
ncbi:PP2C family protein-serine/threonine phosphatase [Allonocardiopsis opalescens]|uniref:Sigma-B regulation protein RsbU (Phosphoserine phosphatase) n=1 Tax=Allonocardiopsis opalescens TaxID=1144618 RepID=A0A2T0PZX1_9ACTN|nr:SpoIIE family protein phosphatase [Allonocardiopsis opalescens]PRX97099.1 sigma-B regulation protein RsbU (phosphoserine phosphatase) [Allonocardiopsis opalescens]